MKRDALVVWAGQTDDNGYSLFEIDSPESTELGKERFYNKKLFKYSRIGGVYKVQFEPKENDPTADVISYFEKQQPIAIFKNVDQIIEWKALDASFEDRNKLLKASKENQLAQRLAPVREAYWKTNAQGRKLILAEVIRIITS